MKHRMQFYAGPWLCLALGFFVEAVFSQGTTTLDGRCGPYYNFATCSGSPGVCCSSSHWCGNGDAWCGSGCNPLYGYCGPLQNHIAGVRLVDGASTSEGRVEVFYNGAWGTVCGNSWTDNDAAVICRQLNLGGGISLGNAHFGEGVLPIVISDVQCTGTEGTLDSCRYSGIISADCTHAQDMGVQCAALPGIAPPNTECSGAISLTCGSSVTGNTRYATHKIPNACTKVYSNSLQLWYTINAPVGQLVLSTCGSTNSFDTALTVSSGSCSDPLCEDCNDDACEWQSTVTIDVLEPTTYNVMVHGFSSQFGAFTLNAECYPPSPPLPAAPNADCLKAISFTCGESVTGNTKAASHITPNVCSEGTRHSRQLWYTVKVPAGYFGLDTSGSSFDTMLTVSKGGCPNPQCIEGGFNDDGWGLMSFVWFQVPVPTTFHIMVHGFGSTAGAFTLSSFCWEEPMGQQGEINGHQACPAQPKYTVQPGVDHWGDDIDYVGPDMDVAAARCNANPECAGFNSDGWLKRIVTDATPFYPWYCLYSKVPSPSGVGKGMNNFKNGLVKSHGPSDAMQVNAGSQPTAPGAEPSTPTASHSEIWIAACVIPGVAIIVTLVGIMAFRHHRRQRQMQDVDAVLEYELPLATSDACNLQSEAKGHLGGPSSGLATPLTSPLVELMVHQETSP